MSTFLDIFGDRWSLLIVRDLMVRGCRRFKEFQESGERIASNVLSARLDRLMAAGIITAEPEESDGRRINYRLTEKGIDLAPALLELLIWGAEHEKTAAPPGLVKDLRRNRRKLLAEVQRRWAARDQRPVIPRFPGGSRRTTGKE